MIFPFRDCIHALGADNLAHSIDASETEPHKKEEVEQGQDGDDVSEYICGVSA